MNQDEKASGGMAGLTFLFANSEGLMGGSVVYEPRNSGYYEQTNIYSFLTSGDGWSKLASSVKSNIVPVKKWTGYNLKNDGGGGFVNNNGVEWRETTENLFLMSLLETGPIPSVYKGAGYALGISGDERYLAFAEEKSRSSFELVDGAWLRDVFRSGGDGAYARGKLATTGQDRIVGEWSYIPHIVCPAFCF